MLSLDRGFVGLLFGLLWRVCYIYYLYLDIVFVVVITIPNFLVHFFLIILLIRLEKAQNLVAETLEFFQEIKPHLLFLLQVELVTWVVFIDKLLELLLDLGITVNLDEI